MNAKKNVSYVINNPNSLKPFMKISLEKNKTSLWKCMKVLFLDRNVESLIFSDTSPHCFNIAVLTLYLAYTT